jgi:hypothetical protein
MRYFPPRLVLALENILQPSGFEGGGVNAFGF